MYIVYSLVGRSGWAKARSKPIGSWSEKKKKKRKKLQLPCLNNAADEEKEDEGLTCRRMMMEKRSTRILDLRKFFHLN